MDLWTGNQTLVSVSCSACLLMMGALGDVSQTAYGGLSTLMPQHHREGVSHRCHRCHFSWGISKWSAHTWWLLTVWLMGTNERLLQSHLLQLKWSAAGPARLWFVKLYYLLPFTASEAFQKIIVPVNWTSVPPVLFLPKHDMIWSESLNKVTRCSLELWWQSPSEVQLFLNRSLTI